MPTPPPAAGLEDGADGTYTPEAMQSSTRSMPRSTILLLEVPCGYMKLGVLSATPRAETGQNKLL